MQQEKNTWLLYGHRMSRFLQGRDGEVEKGVERE